MQALLHAVKSSVSQLLAYAWKCVAFAVADAHKAANEHDFCVNRRTLFRLVRVSLSCRSPSPRHFKIAFMLQTGPSMKHVDGKT